MDPDEALAELRRLIEDFDHMADSQDAYAVGFDLVEELRALDEWLTNGGFMPADWTPNTRAE